MAAFLRKVSANVEWFLVRCQKYRQRPAASASRKLADPLVNVIEIRPLLPVDLDVNEMFVHYLGYFIVFKGLVRHHVAPVARTVADAKKNWLSLYFRPF